MKAVVATLAALVALAQAVPAFTNSAFEVQEGEPFTLTWQDATGDVTILLETGSASDLQPVLTVTTEGTDGSYTWTPPSSLASGTYAFKISDSTGDNYSEQFSYQGSASASASASTAASTTTATSASTSASSTLTTVTSSTTTASSSSSSSSTGSSSSSATSSSSSTSSSTASSTSSSSTATSTPTNSNDSKRLGSPLALVFVTVATLLYFN